ncbi:MAG: hypothetical protein V4576_03440 [Patescibacteria group bacterium]
MQNISSLLKDIQHKKSELQSMAEVISRVSGVSVLEKEIALFVHKGLRKIRLNISGSKRLMLHMKKSLIEQELMVLGVILVL